MGRKAQKRLLFKFRRVEFQREVLNYFYRGAIESILTGNITQWQGFCITQDIKTALQRVIKSHTLSCEVYPAEQNVSLVFATGLIFCSDPKSSPFCQGNFQVSLRKYAIPAAHGHRHTSHLSTTFRSQLPIHYRGLSWKRNAFIQGEFFCL